MTFEVLIYRGVFWAELGPPRNPHVEKVSDRSDFL